MIPSPAEQALRNTRSACSRATRPLSRASLYAIADAPIFSASASLQSASEGAPRSSPIQKAQNREAGAFEEALRFLGLLPDTTLWARFWLYLLAICGALLVAAGVIFFFAWNWAAMHRFLKFAVIEGLIVLCLLLRLYKGPDNPSGKLALLLAAIALGPLLAVYGQNYQTGAQLWELFRTWSILLLLLALLSRQSSLYFLAWLTASVWFADSLGYFSVFASRGRGLYALPEFILFQMLAVAAWEAALAHFDDRPSFAWLQDIWIPRLATLAILGTLTVMVDIFILWPHAFEGNDAPFLLPLRGGCYTLYSLAVVGILFWHRRKRPDVFMLALAVFSLASIPVFTLLRAELLTDKTSDLLIWGILIAGLTAGCGKLLLIWQRQIEAEATASGKHPAIKHNFFAAHGETKTWTDLWRHLRLKGFLATDAPDPQPPCSRLPWHISLMLSIGGWIAALLLICFLASFLAITLHIRAIERPLLLGAALFLGLGALCLRMPGPFGRQFGLALSIAGVIGICIALVILFESERFWPLLCALTTTGAYIPIKHRSFRFIMATASVVFWTWALDALLSGRSPKLFIYGLDDPPPPFPPLLHLIIQTIWFSGLACLIARGWIMEPHWLPNRKQRDVLLPLLSGACLGVALLVLLTLTGILSGGPAPSRFIPSLQAIGLGSSIGLSFFALLLTAPADFSDTSYRGSKRFTARAGLANQRKICLAVALAAIPTSWFLPGLPLALLGFAGSRRIGSTMLLNASAALLAGYILTYYYSLTATLPAKSLSLISAGLLLLAVAFFLRRRYQKQSQTRLQPPSPGATHA